MYVDAADSPSTVKDDINAPKTLCWLCEESEPSGTASVDGSRACVRAKFRLDRVGSRAAGLRAWPEVRKEI